ncbi:UrcA family protein [Citromicrobium bathyomarinum]|uniref:UrcA family protein n=1 Tax=Citromicrobium bathyomarinum TaxID=72174 RepID=UPI003159F043
MKTRILTIAAALAALSAPVLTTPAIASERSVTVSVEDLDLTGSADRAKLESRIATAARIACDSGARDAASLKMERECRAAAIADATARAKVAMVGEQPRLAAIEVSPGA